MDQSGMVSCAVSERLLFGPARDVELGVVYKLGLALTRADLARPADFEADLVDFGNALIRRNKGAIQRVCLDVPLDPLQVNLPLHALFSVWPMTPAVSIDVPQGGPSIGGVSELIFDAIETPPAMLAD